MAWPRGIPENARVTRILLLATVRGTGPQAAAEVSVRPNGSFLLTGWFATAADLGPVKLKAAPDGGGSVLVAAYDASGALEWARAVGRDIGLADAYCELVVLPDGRFAVGLPLAGELVLDDGHVIDGASEEPSGPDTAVVLFGADGAPEAQLLVRGDGAESFYALAAFPDDGSLAVAGYTSSSRVTLGDGADEVGHDVPESSTESVIARLLPE
jgi:hypothetical protein